jgi:phage terminase large subunit
MQLNIKTSKTFTDIYNGPNILCLQGGTRSGKSYSAVQYCIVKALEDSGIMISIVRKSFPSLRISALRDFKEIMKGFGIWDEDKWKASENTYFFDNGSMIEFLSVQDSERRKGTKRDILFIDEANELDYEDYFQLFIRTTQKTILSYNPSFPPQTHWITQQVHTHPEASVVISTYNDNPFLEDNIVQEIERLKDTSPSYWTIYGTGEFGMTEGLIFDNFHTIGHIPEDAELLGYGMDFGFTADPTTMVALWKNEEGIYLDEVFYMRGLLTNQIGNLIRGAYEVEGKAPVIADSAEPRTIDEIFRMGINIKPCIKGKDSIINGIDIMKQHKIFVTKSSKNLIDEFYSYQWMKDKANNLTNQPDPRSNDHAIDAARYVISFMLSQKKKNYGTYTISLR